VKITLLPSTVAGSEPFQFLSSCLINDAVALDAGCVGFYHSPQE